MALMLSSTMPSQMGDPRPRQRTPASASPPPPPLRGDEKRDSEGERGSAFGTTRGGGDCPGIRSARASEAFSARCTLSSSRPMTMSISISMAVIVSAWSSWSSITRSRSATPSCLRVTVSIVGVARDRDFTSRGGGPKGVYSAAFCRRRCG